MPTAIQWPMCLLQLNNYTSTWVNRQTTARFMRNSCDLCRGWLAGGLSCLLCVCVVCWWFVGLSRGWLAGCVVLWLVLLSVGVLAGLLVGGGGGLVCLLVGWLVGWGLLQG